MKKKTAEQPKEEDKWSIPQPEGLCLGEAEIIFHAVKFWGKRSQKDTLRATLERRARNGACLPDYLRALSRFSHYVRKYVVGRWKNKDLPTINEFLDPDKGLWRKDPEEWMPARTKESPAPMATRSIWDDEPQGDLV